MRRVDNRITEFSTGYLKDGSPVVVVHVKPRETIAAAAKEEVGDSSSQNPPMVVVYPRATVRQAWVMVWKSFRLLISSAIGTLLGYCRRCNIAYCYLAHIQSHHANGANKFQHYRRD